MRSLLTHFLLLFPYFFHLSSSFHSVLLFLDRISRIFKYFSFSQLHSWWRQLGVNWEGSSQMPISFQSTSWRELECSLRLPHLQYTPASTCLRHSIVTHANSTVWPERWSWAHCFDTTIKIRMESYAYLYIFHAIDNFPYTLLDGFLSSRYEWDRQA